MEPTPSSLSAPPKAELPQRNVAVDVFRGLVMILMMAEVLRLAEVARAYPGSRFWAFLAYNQTHVEWAGCSLHDLIQPGFSFLVGVALPYSIASRMARGATFGKLFAHAIWRSFVLVVLGIFLRSLHSPQTNFTFEDTLTQIGLGYPFLFLLGFARPKTVWTWFGLILFGYWLAWALYPLPGPDFDWARVGVPPNWPHHFHGFMAHWNKNSNLGAAFDQWFLNLFPRPTPFVANRGGYLTLNFVPTLGTMILGLVAGRWLRQLGPQASLTRMWIAAGAGVASGLALHWLGICPVVKRIWTPAWTLFSGGACFAILAALTWLIDVKKSRWWTLPFVVVGMNSIAAYMIAHLFEDFFRSTFRIHLGPNFFRVFGDGLQPLLEGAAILLCYWLILFWMYRRKLFLKI
ncbi:MAG: acyltransferase family protein [Bryobacteraceae bacterium]